MKLRRIHSSPNYYSVCACDRGERLVLCVVCGGIAMYEVVVELLPEEETRFRAEGHLDDLAYQVAKHESAFAGRTLHPNAPDERIEFVDTI